MPQDTPQIAAGTETAMALTLSFHGTTKVQITQDAAAGRRWLKVAIADQWGDKHEVSIHFSDRAPMVEIPPELVKPAETAQEVAA
jgi:hypothetical protein